MTKNNSKLDNSTTRNSFPPTSTPYPPAMLRKALQAGALRPLRYLAIATTLLLILLATHTSNLPLDPSLGASAKWEALAKWGLTTQVHAAPFPTQSTNLWYPYVEWEINNVSYSDNPFDVIATATFNHQDSSAQHTTQMFYDGGNTWKFRFTGTKTGTWTFTTQSSNSQLNGHTGTINVNPNPNPNAKGFLIAHGNKFARHVGNEGKLEGVVLNIWRNGDFLKTAPELYNNPNLEFELEKGINNYLIPHGVNALSNGSTANNWFNLGTYSHKEHNSENPDIRTFETYEKMITYLHKRGMHFHIWAWGDEYRNWTPIGVGGINGIPDNRLQRYIAARLGPLPGWSMGYGFDLFEWVSKQQTEEWANYMQDHMGWPHLLMAREEGIYKTPDNMDVFSTDERVSSNFYDNAATLLNNSSNRPVLYSRRFMYLRDNVWTMEATRKAFWQFTMAGGAAGWWGITNNDTPYPNPEQLHTHGAFWQNRFLLDMNRDNSYASSWYGLKTPDNKNIALYRESISSLSFTPPTASVGLPIIGVNTKNAYSEINLGTVQSGTNTISLPTSSDWAIAIGNFDSTSPLPTLTPDPTPTTGPTPTHTPVPTTGPTNTPIPGTVITGLQVFDTSNAADWSIKTDLSNGLTQYGDRSFTFTSIPDVVVGANWIQTANDSKSYTNNPLATFTLGSGATVYIALDDRVTPPGWLLDDWIETSHDLTNSEPHTFSLFSKSFAQGQTVTLGSQGGSASMYTVIVVPSDSPSVTYSELILAFGSTTNPDTDLNGDGITNIFDLNRWISQN